MDLPGVTLEGSLYEAFTNLSGAGDANFLQTEREGAVDRQPCRVEPGKDPIEKESDFCGVVTTDWLLIMEVVLSLTHTASRCMYQLNSMHDLIARL